MFCDVRYMSTNEKIADSFNRSMLDAGWNTGFLFFMYGIKYQGNQVCVDVLNLFHTNHNDAWNNCQTWTKCMTEQFDPVRCNVCSEVRNGIRAHLCGFCNHLSQVRFPSWMQPMKTIMGFSEGIGITYRDTFVSGFVEGALVRVENLEIPTEVFGDVCSEFNSPLGCTKIGCVMIHRPIEVEILNEVKQTHALLNENFSLSLKVASDPWNIAQTKLINCHKTQMYCAMCKEQLQCLANAMESSTNENIRKSYKRLQDDCTKISKDLDETRNENDTTISGQEMTINRLKRQLTAQDEVIKRHASDVSRSDMSETEKKAKKSLEERLLFSQQVAEKAGLDKNKLVSELTDVRKELRQVQERNETFESENNITHSQVQAVNECLRSPETDAWKLACIASLLGCKKVVSFEVTKQHIDPKRCDASSQTNPSDKDESSSSDSGSDSSSDSGSGFANPVVPSPVEEAEDGVESAPVDEAEDNAEDESDSDEGVNRFGRRTFNRRSD